jgi:hypothetical protein
VTTVVLPAWPLEVRLTRIVPGGAVRLIEGGPALGVADAALLTRGRSDDGRLAWVTDGSRTVAVRALFGYDAAENDAAPGSLNLTSDHAEQPVALEARASAAVRVVASAIVVGATPPDILAAEHVRVLDVDEHVGTVHLELGGDEEAWVALGMRRWSEVDVAGHRFTGRRLSVVRMRRDGSSAAGDGIERVQGIVRLDRPAPISVTRIVNDDRPIVELVTMTGLAVDPGWMDGAPLRTLEMRRLGGWVVVGALDEPGIVPASVVRSLRRASGRTLVELRLR